LAATAAIAVHVADDSFVQPQPGTSAVDHLAGGLVPLTLLALLAWAFGRVRPGARAAIALGLAPMALIAGAEALHYAGEGGVSGDDYTGLVALAAAPVLAGIGAATLWRSRRRDDRRAWRYPRRALLVVAGALTLFELLGPLMLGYGTTHIARGVTPDADLGAAYEHVTLTTSDGLRLRGWYIPSRNGAAVIAYPGLKGPQRHARMLARHGYGVLLFDRRGEGRSEGDPNAFGWEFDRDISAAVAFLHGRADVEPGRIGGLGLSVGGEAMLQTAAQGDGLAAVVAEGAGLRAVGEELDSTKGLGKILTAPMYATKSAAVAVFGNQAPPPRLLGLLPKIHAPVFLIYARHGEVDPVNPQYFRALRSPKQRWEVPRGGHTAAIRVLPAEYERRVTSFLDQALPAR
jgi:dienelactone hydrolase